MIKIQKASVIGENSSVIYLGYKDSDLVGLFANDELNYINSSIEKKQTSIIISRFPALRQLVLIEKKGIYADRENARKAASKAHSAIASEKPASLFVVPVKGIDKEFVLAFIEGFILTNYQFLKYFSEKQEKEYSLKNIFLVDDRVSESDCIEIESITSGVYFTRDLINEPLSFLTSVQLSKEIKKASLQAGFNLEVLDKGKIETLKMGGLLAVNRGSIDPPTFSILEWKPDNAVNEKPYILVGKGVVFDTGGINLKPTGSLETMKCDMSGAAAVAGTFYAIAKEKLPVYVIGLIPSTDNRPDGNAYVPGDVINMHNGLKVEVLNTDAEGRMILADALSYAKRYNPELVIDLATLTGAAAIAIGKEGIVCMGNDESSKCMSDLKESGFAVHERLVEFPLWDEYDDMLKSDIADLKNIGEREAGAITAGKFLQRFTSYPWIHLDIAGPAFIKGPDSYRGKGGTGIGVRLLFDFLKKKSLKS